MAEAQLLHLVFGGELERLDDVRFRDMSKLDIVGIYPNYAEAYVAWERKARETIDNASEDDTVAIVQRHAARDHRQRRIALLHRPPPPPARPGAGESGGLQRSR